MVIVSLILQSKSIYFSFFFCTQDAKNNNTYHDLLYFPGYLHHHYIYLIEQIIRFIICIYGEGYFNRIINKTYDYFNFCFNLNRTFIVNFLQTKFTKNKMEHRSPVMLFRKSKFDACVVTCLVRL